MTDYTVKELEEKKLFTERISGEFNQSLRA
jgi:hypothetical protein